MQHNGVRLRHELKYYISKKEAVLLRARLKPLLKLDEHTQDPEGYHIRSLYFDDMYDEAVFEKLIGQQRRDKYRVRIYNISDSVIQMERKSKYDAFISKTSAKIERE